MSYATFTLYLRNSDTKILLLFLLAKHLIKFL
nr:MAG TPA: hypothetical protein [Bacteriophage sp.]